MQDSDDASSSVDGAHHLSASQLEAYFERIGLRVPDAATPEALAQVQLAHIMAVPFENLDIIARRVPLRLDTEALFAKIVRDRRGGICYELNFLLADALASIGFEPVLLSGIHPKYGDPFDHALLMVSIPACGQRWIVDVGFADNFRTPLRLDADGAWQDDGRDRYRVRKLDAADERARLVPGAESYEVVRERAGKTALMFTFSLKPRSRSEFQPRCDWFSTSPDSRFTQGPLVSVERPDGRVSLTMNRVLNTYGGTRVRDDIRSEAQFAACLEEIFGMRCAPREFCRQAQPQ